MHGLLPVGVEHRLVPRIERIEGVCFLGDVLQPHGLLRHRAEHLQLLVCAHGDVEDVLAHLHGALLVFLLLLRDGRQLLVEVFLGSGVELVCRLREAGESTQGCARILAAAGGLRLAPPHHVRELLLDAQALERVLVLLLRGVAVGVEVYRAVVGHRTPDGRGVLVELVLREAVPLGVPQRGVFFGGGRSRGWRQQLPGHGVTRAALSCEVHPGELRLHLGVVEFHEIHAANGRVPRWRLSGEQPTAEWEFIVTILQGVSELLL